MIGSVFARNVGLSTVLRLSSFLLQFAMLPVLIRSLGQHEYGVWVVLQTLVVWVALLEFGISKGLRNKLIESFSVGDDELARRYISSTFMIQCVLWGSSIVLLALAIVFWRLPWAQWLQSASTDRSLGEGILYCFITFSLTQLFGVTNAILYAKHWNAATSLVSFFSSLGLFLYAYLAMKFGYKLDIPRLAFANLMLFAVGYSIQSLYLVRMFPDLVPRWRFVSWGIFREVLDIGIRFLVVEITFIVIFVMDRWIVLRQLGPIAVTEYDILLRFSSLVTTGYALFTGPAWALSGTAWAKGDLPMMDKLWRLISGLMIPFILVALALGVLVNWMIHRWIDPTITVSSLAAWSMVFYSWVVIWGSGYASLFNGFGRVREHMLCSILACMINIPLAIYLSGLNGFGIAGVLIASTISLSIFAIVAPFVWLDCRRRCGRSA